MNVIWSATLRTCRNPKPFVKVDRWAPHLTHCGARSYSVVSRTFLQRRNVISNILPCHSNAFSKFALDFTRQVRTHASSPKIIATYEDLPSDYDYEDGLQYRATPVSQEEVDVIFGKGFIDVPNADRILRLVHGRRVAGIIDDPSFNLTGSGFDSEIEKMALVWLRKNLPVDETRSAEKRAEIEIQEMEQNILTDAERLGLYKPNSGTLVEDRNQQERISQDAYEKGALDAIRESKKALQNERDKVEKLAREQQAAEVRHNTGTLTTPSLASRVELRRPGENPWLKHYLNRAKVLPDTPPELTFLQRIWPSALLAVLIVGGTVIFTTIYTPPNRSGRIWPDVPPAAATMTVIIAANVMISVLWRFPPAFRVLNKYFISVPGYPRSAAVLGNIFSHQSFSHLFVNMAVLWFVGTRLHDDIGRANFMAIYLSSGVLASLTSLTMYTLQKNFVISSMGASGAIAGLLAAYLWLHGGDSFKAFGLPPDPASGISGGTLLFAIVLIELFQLRRRWTGGQLLDHYSHLGGYAAGLTGIELLERHSSSVKKDSESRKKQLERQRNFKLLDKWKESGRGE